MKLNEQITQLRKAQKMSQEELAAALGVSRQAISKWENGQSNPDTENLIRLAEIFQVDVNVLVREEDAPYTTPTQSKAGVPVTVVWALSIACVLALTAAVIFAGLWQKEAQLRKELAATPPTTSVGELKWENIKLYSGLLKEEIDLTEQEQQELIGYITRFKFTEAPNSTGRNEDGQILCGGRNYMVEYTQDGVSFLWHFLEHGFSCTVNYENTTKRYHYATDWMLLYEIDSYVY